MYDDGAHRNPAARASETAESLLRRIDEVTREIEAVRNERAAEPLRAARMRLAVAHRAKRLMQRLGAPRGGSAH